MIERIAWAIKQGGTARVFSCPGIQILNCGMGGFFLFRTLSKSPMDKDRAGEKGNQMANVEIPYKIY
ncbi:MAG: hypothetical protein J6S28_00165, partial [Clostridia bacterium]|nr:hypothetical protein [Clostridia bacterium]